jgi:A/G-specific adenine glycosylase
MMDFPPEQIAVPLLAWFAQHGRHDLPWQHPRTAYRAWVAEIMLQQTQVRTVIAYFNAFMARFPDIETLAAADAEAVMAHWAGLGYYARARNLHAAAKLIVAEHGGVLPADVETLMTLPGIGRSTAGAIVAQAYGRWAPILDGNAKRVLARIAGLEATPGTAAFEQPLWRLAERYTPRARIADYTQAIMDLGAMLCTRRRPACACCPLADRCLAYARGLQARIPAPRKRAARAVRQATMIIAVDENGRILLEKRPPAGIWGGLWSLPEKPAESDLDTFCRETLGLAVRMGPALAPVEHGFTHFKLRIYPRRVQVIGAARIMEGPLQWYARDALPGVPAPIARILHHQQMLML